MSKKVEPTKENEIESNEPIDETLAKFEKQFGEAFKIEAEYPKGTKLVGYYKAPDYQIKKQIFTKMFLDGDQIAAAEVILAKCWVAGDNLYTIEPIRLECAVHIMQNMDNTFNDSVTLKKNSNQKPGN